MRLSDKLEIASISDVGRRRPHNEDSTLSDLEKGVVVLADGDVVVTMGFRRAAELA